VTTATISSETDTAVRFLDQLFDGVPPKNVSFQFWNGQLWPDDHPRPATLVLRHEGTLRAMFGAGTEKALAEAFLHDDFDIVGEIEAAFELVDRLQHRPADWLAQASTFYRLHRLPASSASHAARKFAGAHGGKHSPTRDRDAVSFHYDVSNDFFRLWLDRRMLYSCAYFEDEHDDIDTAQTAKVRHICRKLRLRPGQRLLDIGCGWGGLALYAAQQHGVHVTGITLSKAQAQLATERAAAAGLQDRVAIELRDYRDLGDAEAYDAIVSVGMSEHVGADQLAGYFRTVAPLLKPGGVFLNHAIGEGVRSRARRGPSFIEEYVFPDSDIPPIRDVVAAAEGAKFEVRDVENLRDHYALTLRHWVRRLEANHAAALAWVNEATYRVWRLYMAGSAHGFARGELAVYQVLLAKPDAEGRAHLPLTRRDWYQ
jgi:cyclopropane-fatty-acyl-phospholipid synthase